MGHCQRGNASLCVYVCVTSATVANRHQSEQWKLKHLHQDLQPLFGLGIFENHLFHQKFGIDLVLFHFTFTIYCFFYDYVQIYDGELKW